jgi:hypothetical protein
MKRIALITALVLAALPAQAACVAEYKATQSNPLRLDYGFITLPEGVCTVAEAERYVRSLLAGRGWTLEKILSVSDSG